MRKNKEVPNDMNRFGHFQIRIPEKKRYFWELLNEITLK